MSIDINPLHPLAQRPFKIEVTSVEKGTANWMVFLQLSITVDGTTHYCEEFLPHNEKRSWPQIMSSFMTRAEMMLNKKGIKLNGK